MNCMEDQDLIPSNSTEDHDVAPGSEVWVGPMNSWDGLVGYGICMWIWDWLLDTRVEDFYVDALYLWWNM